MFHGKKFLLLTLLVSLFSCLHAWPQEQQENDRRHASGYAAATTGRERVSDLAKENLERVAASSSLLQTVLIKDPGILVELKRWVAKEATDSGQVVDDNALTDQAIFDRLERDVAFRSIATQLVQRYGYLLPTLNPDSDVAKEQELILKQRARRMLWCLMLVVALPPAFGQASRDHSQCRTAASPKSIIGSITSAAPETPRAQPQIWRRRKST